jgi:hypothetical protein
MNRLLIPRLLAATAAVAIGLSAALGAARRLGAGAAPLRQQRGRDLRRRRRPQVERVPVPVAPEKKVWVTIDESFRMDGETRKVLPLPVGASEVARMEGFGFIVTRSGNCWLYNLDSNRWENIGRP